MPSSTWASFNAHQPDVYNDKIVYWRSHPSGSLGIYLGTEKLPTQGDYQFAAAIHGNWVVYESGDGQVAPYSVVRAYNLQTGQDKRLKVSSAAQSTPVSTAPRPCTKTNATATRTSSSTTSPRESRSGSRRARRTRRAPRYRETRSCGPTSATAHMTSTSTVSPRAASNESPSPKCPPALGPMYPATESCGRTRGTAIHAHLLESNRAPAALDRSASPPSTMARVPPPVARSGRRVAPPSLANRHTPELAGWQDMVHRCVDRDEQSRSVRTRSTPLSTTRKLRIRFAGDSSYASGTSPVKTVKPKAYLTTPSVPKRVYESKLLWTKTFLKPKHTRAHTQSDSSTTARSSRTTERPTGHGSTPYGPARTTTSRIHGARRRGS